MGGKACGDTPDQPEALLGQRRVELHGAGASAQLFNGLLGRSDAADADQRQLAIGRARQLRQDAGGFFE